MGIKICHECGFAKNYFAETAVPTSEQCALFPVIKDEDLADLIKQAAVRQLIPGIVSYIGPRQRNPGGRHHNSLDRFQVHGKNHGTTDRHKGDLHSRKSLAAEYKTVVVRSSIAKLFAASMHLYNLSGWLFLFQISRCPTKINANLIQ